MTFARALSVATFSDRSIDMDGKRLETTYHAYHLAVWRTLRRMGCTPEAAADYTQQAYLIMAERLSDIYEGSEKAYLFSTAIGLSRTAARKLRRVDLVDDVDLGSDAGDAAQALSDRQMALQILDRIFSKMDPDLAAVFTLFEMEGMSSPEIAAILEIPLGTVASRLRRGRELFRKAAARIRAGEGAPSQDKDLIR